MLPREIIDHVRSLPVAQVLALLGHTPNPRGRGWPCPKCGEAGRKAAIGHNGDVWYCHACGTGGSSVDLVLHARGLPVDRIETPQLEALAEVAGGSVTPWQPAVKPTPPPTMTPAQLAAYWRACDPVTVPVALWTWLALRGVSTSTLALITARVRPWSPGLSLRARPDLRAAVEAGVCAVFPLRSTHPERVGEIRNLMIRPIHPTVIDRGERRPWKSKPLAQGDGSCSDGPWPLVYGDPGPALDARVLVVTEGAIDTLTAEALSEGLDGVRVIGARCAGDLRSSWSPWLAGFRGTSILLVPHLDKPTERHPDGDGLDAMRELRRQLVSTRPELALSCPENAKRPRLRCFPWPALLQALKSSPLAFRASGLSDLNDLVRHDIDGPRIPWPELATYWRKIVG